MIFHGADDFENSFNILDIFFDKLCLATVRLLFLNETVNPFFLILFDLFVFFPGDFLESFFFLMGAPDVFAEVLCHCFIESHTLLMHILR